MDSNKSVTANFKVKTYSLNITAINGTVAKTPDQISYDCGSIVNLKATPNSGYKFLKWEGNTTSVNGDSATVAMDSDKNVTALFEELPPENCTLTKNIYPITDSVPTGTITASPDKDVYIKGEKVVLTANATNPCYEFTNWSEDYTGTGITFTLTMNSNKSVRANFKLKTYSMNISATNGTVTKTPDRAFYNCGETVTLKANPNNCYEFTGFSGDCTGTACTLTMDSNKSVTANFRQKIYSINITANNGTVTKNPDKTSYNCGDTVTITANPNNCYEFTGFSGDCSGTACTLAMYSDKSVNANFKVKTNIITASAETGGTISPDGNVSVNCNEDQEFIITPDLYYEVDKVVADDANVTLTDDRYIFTNVTSAHNISVIFKKISGDPCDLTTATKSQINGQWDTITWSNGLPDADKDVIIAHEITVTDTAGSGEANFNARNLCILENGILKGVDSSMNIYAENVHSYGQMLGADGTAASGGHEDRSSSKMGKDIRVYAGTLVNEKSGQIYGGRGGDDITYLSFKGETIDANGADGGGILLKVDKIINHGKIGPRPISWWDHGVSHEEDYKAYYQPDQFNDEATGGNGGDGANAHIYDIRNWEGNGDPTNFNKGDASGGNGGKTVLDSLSVLNTGRICGGNGGVAVTWYEYGSAYGGNCSDLGNNTLECNGSVWENSPSWNWFQGTTFPILLPGGTLMLGTSQIINQGMLCTGRGGDAWIEPDMLLSTQNSRIVGGMNLTLYGGENFEMKLNNLSEEAITADGIITLVVGKGGVIDLRNNPDNVIKAGIRAEIFADKVLLDDDKKLEEIVNAPSVVVKPGKILYHAELSGSGQIDVKEGTAFPVILRLLNGATVRDIYTLSVSDSAGWQLGTLPVEMTLDALKSEELTIDVKIPEIVNGSDTVTVRAVSNTDPTVAAEAEVQLTTVKIDMADAILALKVIAGLNVSVSRDINGDGKTGLEEVIYILQKVAGIR